MRAQTKAGPGTGENVEKGDLISISEVELMAHGL